jgi:hypothetical protein
MRSSTGARDRTAISVALALRLETVTIVDEAPA